MIPADFMQAVTIISSNSEPAAYSVSMMTWLDNEFFLTSIFPLFISVVSKTMKLLSPVLFSVLSQDMSSLEH